MANQLESILDSFEVKRLRSLDASYLDGASRPSTEPEPSLRALGPLVQGPVAGAVGASEYWAFSVSIPAIPDVCWVCVSDYAVIHSVSGQGSAVRMLVVPFSLDIGGAITLPFLYGGPGELSTSTNSSNVPELVGMPTSPRPRGLWIPLDPELTKDGFVCRVIIKAHSTGLAQNQHSVALHGVRYIGYPVNAWGTGWLHDQARLRGS